MNWLAAAPGPISGTLLADPLIAWFAILGGAAGFIALALTLVRLRAPVAAPPTARAIPAPSPSASPVTSSGAAVPQVPIPPVGEPISSEVMALLAAAVAMALGRNARIAAVVPVNAPSVELLQQWSIEGRRQIYSSHQIR